jgi:hypothetical protein
VGALKIETFLGPEMATSVSMEKGRVGKFSSSYQKHDIVDGQMVKCAEPFQILYQSGFPNKFSDWML